ncbi:hypothetical protein FisN_37Lh025 [Fistulifera solaris]|uniref:Glycosyl transferase CAP10 domain-containing protein n=1 Tax=Fistulifera solaris TaxID=1519565 RepID=A0A1Z5K0H3_FISSO|nr:hypothetical protein FisN_37Lh025 [Fistulifera solaris]|eukprot:GAX19757.1 hypothetical protein FisN_37Lh025 [Fistulifera solaris]
MVVSGRPSPEIRGLFGPKGDSLQWLEATSSFPNGVPRFASKQECSEFMEQYVKSHGGSNPDFPHLQHIFTTLIGWEQIEKWLLPNMEQARKETSLAPRVPRNYGTAPILSSQNIYEAEEAWPAVQAIAQRLDVPFHRCTTPASVLNSLKYLFYHMKFGIYVMIRNGKLRIFAPFVNDQYRNVWGDRLQMEVNDLETYYLQKAGLYREEQVEPDRSKWWANGNIICNELTKLEDQSKSQHWGDHFLAPLRDMLGEAARERKLPDCEFFLNKRDYPQLKVNIERGVPVEPYGFIFDKDDRDPEQDVDLVEEHKFATYAPIVSFYAAAPDRFTDIPWPSSEDWEAACGLVFPHTFMHETLPDGTIEMNGSPRDLFTEANFRKFERAWDDGRIATAFFRGTATGGGTTIENNQRLKVAYLSHAWKDDPVKGGEEPYLDGAIVGWNLRDKKIADSPMTFLRPKEFEFTAGRHHFTPIYEQSKYKYLVYVDGHCAACRYGFMMRLGSVILKVEPRQVADRMWYFPLLKPYHDHVPVKADLSDLEEKIAWCRAHDDECRKIGENAKLFYEKYVGRRALLDYLEMVCKHIAKRHLQPPSWWQPPPRAVFPPDLRKPEAPCYKGRGPNDADRLCTRCQDDYDAEVRQAAEAEKEKTTEKLTEQQRRILLRERMRKRAKKG